jgi:hypothetical protein
LGWRCQTSSEPHSDADRIWPVEQHSTAPHVRGAAANRLVSREIDR